MTIHRFVLPAFLIAGTLAAAAQTAPAPPPSAPAPPATTPAPASAPTAPSNPPAAAPTTPAPAPAPPQAAAPTPADTPPAAPPAAAANQTPNIIDIPAGTKVLLELRSAVNTKSAKPGDGVYLSSTFPVVVGSRVVIPSGVYVQGVVDSVVRPGRGMGAKKAQLNMHFTSMIFPNGSVVEIPGVVNALPGSEHQKVNGDEGTIEQDGGSNKAHNAGETAKVAVPTGATIGSIGGLEGGHPLAGGLEGAGAGLAAAGIVALFTRGADVNIPSGTQVEMVLQRPLQLQEANVNGPTSLVPASGQQQPMPKPARQRIMCPAGSLGCT